MADIAINKGQWDAISAEEQDKIQEGLRSTGSIRPEYRIIGDPNTPPFDENSEFAPFFNPIKDLCKVACDVAAGAAVGWCTANTAGLGLAACLAAAEVARQECRNRC